MENETFIKTYDNAIPHVLCDMLIEKFDANTDQWENRDKRTEDRGNLKFNEVHLFRHMETWKEEVQALANLFKIYVDDYKNQYNEFMFPQTYAIEPFKMKKYEANGLDEFGWHVDVNSTGSMNRWLAFFCYLSDNDEGHTSFPYQKVTTDCKKGTIVLFPPMWPWLHQGAKPVGKPKYFLGSYLLYTPPPPASVIPNKMSQNFANISENAQIQMARQLAEATRTAPVNTMPHKKK